MIEEDELRAAVEKAQELREACDDMNGTIADFEGTLRRLNLGVTAKVSLTDETGSAFPVLAFQKHNGEWRLTFSHRDGVVDRLSTATRALRLRAVERFPALLKALMAAVDVEIARVDQASESTDQLIDEIALKIASKKAGP